MFTRGVERRNIFLSDKDRERFLELLIHYLPQTSPTSFSTAIKLKKKQLKRTNEGKGLVDILCYCLMDNHVHILLHENTAKGINIVAFARLQLGEGIEKKSEDFAAEVAAQINKKA